MTTVPGERARPIPPAEGAVPAGVAGYLTAVASRAPAPGGGSVVGVTGALAAALGAMVVRFTLPEDASIGGAHELAPVLRELDAIQADLLRLADADAAAYGAYRSAAALPKATDFERSRRRQAMQAALTESTEVPLAAARACRRLLGLLATVAAAGNPHLRSDAEIGALLAAAALRGSLINVRGNLAMLKDAATVARLQADADELDRFVTAEP